VEQRLGLHRQPVLLRKILQRNLRPRADVLDHFGRRERAQPPGVFMAGIAHQAEQEAGGEQIAAPVVSTIFSIGYAGRRRRSTAPMRRPIVTRLF